MFSCMCFHVFIVFSNVTFSCFVCVFMLCMLLYVFSCCMFSTFRGHACLLVYILVHVVKPLGCCVNLRLLSESRALGCVGRVG